jgi:N-acetylglucosamine repressor
MMLYYGWISERSTVMRKTGNNQYLRKMNQSTILDLIRTNEGISRIELAAKTGLSATAISAIVKTLLKDGYIMEVGEGKSSGGRKPTMLKLRPESYYSFGFDIDVGFIYTIIGDITGKIIYEHKYETDKSLKPVEAVDKIADIYYRSIRELKLSQEYILGVGISIAGLIDSQTKKVVLAPNLGWSDVSIKEILEEKLKNTIYIENEAMCSAICENWFGSCRGIDDFICINIESGIGAGIFVRGMSYRGSSGNAGEIGHIPVASSGSTCKCGKKGCLETVASASSMLARYRKSPEYISSPVYGADDDEVFSYMVEKAKNGDTLVLKIFHDAAVSLGKAIGFLINMFNPERIVLGKKFPQYGDMMLELIKSETLKTALSYPAQNCRIISSGFCQNSSAIGATAIPIKKLFGW